MIYGLINKHVVLVTICLAFTTLALPPAPAGAIARAAGSFNVGVIMSDDMAHFRTAHESFLKELDKAGYGPDKVNVYVQSPNPDPMSWLNSVRKFVSVDVDVIVTYGSPAAHVALKEADGIPVVFAFVYSPEAELSTTSMTGVSSKVPVQTLIKTLKMIKPFKKLAVVYNPMDNDSGVQVAEIEKLSGVMGFTVVDVEVKKPSDIKSRLKGIADKADSMFICSSVAAGANAKEVVNIAAASGLPTATMLFGLSEYGAVVSLAPSAEEQGELTAHKVASILGGGKPGDMPLLNSKRIELVLNLKTINSLGIKIPFDILNTATKVIK